MRTRQQHGFTLIEMMVVVAIIAILAAIAYPNYSDYAFRARRADGKEMMMRVAAAQERYYTNLNTYGAMAVLGVGTTSELGHYTVGVVLGNGGQTYVLTAEGNGIQASDKCGDLTLTNSGSKGFSGNQNNGKCW